MLFGAIHQNKVYHTIKQRGRLYFGEKKTGRETIELILKLAIFEI